MLLEFGIGDGIEDFQPILNRYPGIGADTGIDISTALILIDNFLFIYLNKSSADPRIRKTYNIFKISMANYVGTSPK